MVLVVGAKHVEDVLLATRGKVVGVVKDKTRKFQPLPISLHCIGSTHLLSWANLNHFKP